MREEDARVGLWVLVKCRNDDKRLE